MKWIKPIALALGVTLFGLFAVMANPQLFFANHVTYGRYQVWSDRPIDAGIRAVLDDTERRLATSELMSPDQHFRIFLCNDNWRLALFSQRFSGGMGGVADTWLTQNVYLREVDIPRNRLIPPSGWTHRMDDRPLSYYMAHELTHILEARAFGLLAVAHHQRWVWEGYADLIGKGGQFDIAANRAALARGDEAMDWARSGLYRRFHLEVAYLLQQKHLPLADLISNPPPAADIDREILADDGWR